MAAIRNSESNREGKLSFLKLRRLRSKKLQLDVARAKIRRFELRNELADTRLANFKESQRAENLLRIMRGYESARNARERYAWVLEQRRNLQRFFLKSATVKELTGAQRVKDDKEMLRMAHINSVSR
jgi:hypothetical protein